MSLLLDAPGDAGRRVALRRMRFLATGLLLVAAILFALTLRDHRAGWLGYVNAGTEAAMIGALADWFAVTAIFRHPLGLPIPHTALVKRRKDELGRSLQEFVTNNFLTEEIIREKVASAHLAARVAEWLSDAAHRTVVLAQVVKGARLALARVRDEDVASLVQHTVLPRLVEEPLSPVVGAFLEGVVADGAHQGLIDLVFRELHSWLERYPDAFRSVVDERTPRWAPKWVDRRVVNWSYDQALEWTAAVRDEPHHRARVALNGLLTKLAQDLQHDPVIMAHAESLKARVLTHPSIGPTVLSLWDSVRDSLTAAMDDQASSLWRRGDGWLKELAVTIAGDAAMRERLDARLQDGVAFLVLTYGEEASSIISATVERWDADEASTKIELFVGRDLQFIRINGTVVGALAGLGIQLASQLLHG